jgi:hypothetical protein
MKTYYKIKRKRSKRKRKALYFAMKMRILKDKFIKEIDSYEAYF